jgi:hypothetical protein
MKSSRRNCTRSCGRKPPHSRRVLSRHFERRQRRILPEVRGRDLIDGHGAVRLCPSPGSTPLNQVPGLSACTGGAMAPLFDPLTIVNCFWNGANGLRIGVNSKFALGDGRPLLHDGAVRQIQEPMCA